MQRFVDSSAAIIERYTAVDDIQGWVRRIQG